MDRRRRVGSLQFLVFWVHDSERALSYLVLVLLLEVSHGIGISNWSLLIVTLEQWVLVAAHPSYSRT